MEYISPTVKAITFSIDKRFEKIWDKNKVNEFFSVTNLIDWGPGIFSQDFVKQFLPKMKNILFDFSSGGNFLRLLKMLKMDRSRNADYFSYRVYYIISYQRKDTASNIPVMHASVAAI